MCRLSLSVPWEPPPAIPQKYPKVAFDSFACFCTMWQQDRKIRPPIKVLNLLLLPNWKRWFWGATPHFFGIDVPGCAILVFSGTPPKWCWKKIKPPKGISPFFGAYMKHLVLRFYWPFFRNGKCQKLRRPTRGPCNSASYVKKVVLQQFSSFSDRMCLDVPS